MSWLTKENAAEMSSRMSLDIELVVGFIMDVIPQWVQPLPPLKVEVGVSNTSSGDFLLSWETAYEGTGNRLTSQDFEHEVQYKRDWEPWEDLHSLPVPIGTSYILRRQKLVPGNTYVARVRTRLREKAIPGGLWSDWSASLPWNVPEGTAAAPKNLQCSFNGVNRMRCSWEVRTEVTEAISFILYYQEGSQGSETPCHHLELKPDPQIPILFYSCEFLLSNPEEPGLVQISVKPETKTKSIVPHQNIKLLPPSDLRDHADKDGEVYQLTWVPQPLEYDHIKQSYQLCYHKRKEDEKGFDQFSMDCPPGWKEVNIANGPASLSFNLVTQLDPASQYTARVRARVRTDGHADSYNGPWSDWSEAVTWETKAVWNPQIVFLLLLLVALGMVTGAFPCYHCLKRSKRRWEEKIPNPRKSQMLASFLQKGSPASLSTMQTPGGPLQSRPETEDRSSFSLLDERKCKHSWDMATVIQNLETVHADACDFGQIFGTSVQMRPASDTLLPSVSAQSCGYQCFPAGGGDYGIPKAGPSRDEGSSCSDFNGPYLLFPRSSRQSNDLVMDLPTGKQGSISLPQAEDFQTPQTPDSLNAASLHFGYVLCPPETVPYSTDPKTAEEECEKYQAQEEEEAHQKCLTLSITEQAALSGIEEQLTAGSGDYIMVPPNLLMPTVDSPFTQSFCSQQSNPSADPDQIEGLIPAPVKLVEIVASGYVDTPSTLSSSSPSPKSSPSSTEGTGDPLADRLLIFNPDGESPVLLHQIGDYCFFPGSMALESSVKGGDLPQAETPQKPSLSPEPEDSQPGGTVPNIDVIQMFKVMQNDYVAFP